MSLTQKMGKLSDNEKLTQVMRLMLSSSHRYLLDCLALRQSSETLRVVHDQLGTTISLGRPRNCLVQPTYLPSPDEVKKTIHGVFARGCKPRGASTRFDDLDLAEKSSSELEALT